MEPIYMYRRLFKNNPVEKEFILNGLERESAKKTERSSLREVVLQKLKFSSFIS